VHFVKHNVLGIYYELYIFRRQTGK